MKKWMIGVGVVLIAAAAGTGGYYYWSGQKPAAEAAEAASLSARATRGDIVVKVSGSGSVAADTKETVQAGQNGTIAELGFKVGDKVKAGQVLAVFEQEDVGGQIDQLTLNIKKQQLQMDQYEKQYKEAASSAETDASSLASIELNIEMLKLEMATTDKELSEVREQQAEKLEVKASIDGIVTAGDWSAGDTVQANSVIAEIVNYESLTFNVQVDELDMPRIGVGQAAEVHLSAYPDQTFAGEIIELAQEGSVSGGVAAYEVAIALKETEGVLAGMSGQADMIIASREDVVVVPVDAVVELMGKTYVRVPGEGGTDADATGQQQGGNDAAAGQRPGTGGAGATGAGTMGGRGQDGAMGGAGMAGAGTTGGQGGRPARPEGQAPSGDGTGAQAQQASQPESQSSAEAEGQGQASGEGPTDGDAQGATGGRGQGGAMAGLGDDRMNAMAERLGLGGQLKEVTVGISDETYAEIVSGLSEGDTVLVPLPQGAVGTASGTQTEMAFPGGMGGFGGGNLGGGGFGGGGQGQGQGGTRGSMMQGGGAR